MFPFPSTALCYGTYPVEPSHEGGSTFLMLSIAIYSTDSFAHVTPVSPDENYQLTQLEIVSVINTSPRFPRSSLSCSRTQTPECLPSPVMTTEFDQLERAVHYASKASLWLYSYQTRQITPPTKNGHAPPPIESRKIFNLSILTMSGPGKFSRVESNYRWYRTLQGRAFPLGLTSSLVDFA